MNSLQIEHVTETGTNFKTKCTACHRLYCKSTRVHCLMHLPEIRHRSICSTSLVYLWCIRRTLRGKTWGQRDRSSCAGAEIWRWLCTGDDRSTTARIPRWRPLRIPGDRSSSSRIVPFAFDRTWRRLWRSPDPNDRWRWTTPSRRIPEHLQKLETGIKNSLVKCSVSP